MTLLEVKNLKTYFYTRAGTVKAVDEVTFKLEKEQTLGLAGESGCGKTTTCLSIMRMIQPPGKIEGNVFYNSRDLGKISNKEMKAIRGSKIAMIFQGAMNALNPVHRVGNQIYEVIKIHEPEISKEEGYERVFDVLINVGIDPERAIDYPHQLSGGMQQRALIALSLVSNPDIIMADEPVTALDVIVQSQVLKSVKELKDKLGLSMIMITHDLSVIAEVCDNTAIMYAGKLVEFGGNREIFKEPLHPYTTALLSAFPSLTGPKMELREIKGAPPDLLDPPSGCRFHPRCPKVMDICKKEVPEYSESGKGRFVACHLY
ncbi:MAG: ABC transporter ATP-binding protein [Candidatus Hodarchaeales archaeon]|jgi:peptide/nickel transport system ATP-binding protein